ncbi:hypothetical protein [Methanococcus voltae]|uniref:Uncharacterized protein n=1 Tax=Methanococcus voltae (strain ATCC BAA-1334 / A3) TaxID=456320 RepID=D7DTZ1_METV3|nr:hypothetical protein [Methanococcus voltae]MCS3900401.1 seryl-tRNA synthetase [Methanococcus voltae]
MNMSDSVEEINIDTGLDLEKLDSVEEDLSVKAESLKSSMDSILNKIKFAVQSDDEELQSMKADINKISGTSISTPSNSNTKECSEMNSEILNIINNKLDVLIDAKDEQNLMLKKISEDIDDMLIKIDKSADLIMENFENQNVRFDNLLGLLQDILEGIQQIKGLLSDMNMNNMTKASNVVDNLKHKIDDYIGSDNTGVASC